jgi:hypothetical protein
MPLSQNRVNFVIRNLYDRRKKNLALDCSGYLIVNMGYKLHINEAGA